MEDGLSVMVVDGGARGHTISNAYEVSPQVKRVIVVPRNEFIGYERNKELIVDSNCSLKPLDNLLVRH